MNGLDLFSGIGGLTLALQEWVNPIAYCEIEPYAQGVLASRMSEGRLPIAPIWDDVRTLTASVLPVQPDIIYGGFPCQDISVAGRGKGLAGERSGLFFEITRLIKECGPTFIFLENVPAIRTRGLDAVIKELANQGYDLRWTDLSASEIGANHKRNRWWLLGYSKHNGSSASKKSGSINQTVPNDTQGEDQASESKGANTSRMLSREFIPNSRCFSERTSKSLRFEIQECERSEFANVCCHISHSNIIRPQEQRQLKYPIGAKTNKDWQANRFNDDSWWAIEPNVGRVANGVLHRVDRIKSLGNAVVPAQAKEAFKILCGFGGAA